MMSTEFDEALKGATITKVTLKEDGESITFDLQERPSVTLDTFGDCCSLTWIESLDAPDALLGTVQSVEDIEMPNLGNIDGARHKDVDEVSYYGLKITTNHGVCVIDYRNDSNGYYGGNLGVRR
jgi:hypothetical protein